MDPESIRKDLGVADYLSFVLLMAISTIIGVYFAYKDRNDATTKNYFFGGKQMHPVAVGLSLAVTFQSAIVVIAAPAETYISGTLMMWEPITRILAVPIVLLYLIPLYHRLQLDTVYQYLELRYNSTMRRATSALLSLGSLFYVGTVVYMPAVALNAVTPLSMASSIILTGVICTVYTTLGGMKAVIWTDVIQSGILILGLVAVFIKGLMVVGGFDEMYGAIERGDRLTAFRFDYGIISRLSPGGIIAGAYFMSLGGIGVEQAIVQRFQTCETSGKARCALLVHVVPTIIIGMTSVGNGLIMYAYYEGCDPVKSRKLQNIDQGIPYMTLEIFENIPGMAGIFVSTIFSASLSTISSCLNSLSVLILEDFIVAKWPSLTERRKVAIGKITGGILGIILILLAFGISASEANAFELLYGFTGLTYGPGIAVYFLGFFFPWANAMGAMIGMLTGYMLLALLFIGRQFFNTNPYRANIPTVSTNLCPANYTLDGFDYNVTTLDTSTISGIEEIQERTFLRDLYNINFNFLMMIGFVITIVVGIIASFISGHTPASKATPRLFVPIIDNKIFPSKVRKFFRFGVPELPEEREVEYKPGARSSIVGVDVKEL
uniref:sodium-coupled monocarboxylate transporter 1-like n=1 Tax=Styela clava TaxID=7725 RepID=UPI00193A3307|nr:sodium-coupled monocarboxylate transporter 1-like [Styela clava]